MRFSILHLSDLHRDPTDEVANQPLLASLERDIAQYNKQDPVILKPALCIVSGDLVYGVNPSRVGAGGELQRQWTQAEELLVAVAERLFGGDRERIVLLPGNHDVSFIDVMGSVQRIDIPADATEKAALIGELFTPKSRLRWSWHDLCFFRITDEDGYRHRLDHFAALYDSFYQGTRAFSPVLEQQHAVHDYPDLGFCVLALNSCYNNDPFNRAGSIHPTSVVEGCRAIAAPQRAGWLLAAAWHHSVLGGPTQTDYLDVEVLQVLMDAGVSVGFHGHQHRPDCIDELYRLGRTPRKMTVISASTLSAGPRSLTPGVPRSYNVIEVDTSEWTGRAHQRQMVNRMFNLPVWGPGHFNVTGTSYIDFTISRPLAPRPAGLDARLALSRAEELLGAGRYVEAEDLLRRLPTQSLARPLLVRALTDLGDGRRTIDALWPPITAAEAVIVGAAILDGGTKEDAAAFLNLELVSTGADASIREIVHRIRLRWS